MSDRTLQCPFDPWRVNHNAFAFYPDSTNLGISALLRSSAVTSVTC